MTKDSFSKAELDFVETMTEERNQAIEQEHKARSEAFEEIGQATRAAVEKSEVMDATKAIRTLVDAPDSEGSGTRSEIPGREPDISGAEQLIFGDLSQGIPTLEGLQRVSSTAHALPEAKNEILRHTVKAPFKDPRSFRRTTVAAWADPNSAALLRDGYLGGNCGFAPPGGEGMISTWYNIAPMVLSSKAKALVAGYTRFLIKDWALVPVIGYANATREIEFRVFDLKAKQQVIHIRERGNLGMAVIPFTWDSGTWSRWTAGLTIDVKPGSRYSAQFRFTQTCGGGGIIVGGHNKDQVRTMWIEFIELNKVPSP